KAKELGMTHTHFSNSTGLQDENHYTTVKDLSALLGYALQNQTFRDIFT
ncbi:MAG TPA: D-alanyl-D-alanine carboxypeptidase, partial [Ruminococcaceae bacterium]|nr:D-alanyl-D-alanine carboxypeptidase [Oscillospiraceae bacterium]